ERLLILAPREEIGPADLPLPAPVDGALAADAPLKDARDDFERRYILAALKRYRGNVTRTAEALAIERSNLHRKLKSYGIEVERE
ncbi:MAG TPA: helix-turn-helix domain-containing protein, partial [Thermoanaerobaculia bacterium]|nr:helix-turn-helix domain-containing protein [Thermoanaerobaculia bacterium]